MIVLRKLSHGAVLAALALATPACGGDDVGTVRVFFEPEDTVFGLEAGADEENILDGWNIEYDKFLVTVGNIKAESNEVDQVLSEPGFFVVDLIEGIPQGGLILAEFEDAQVARFDKFSYDILAADANTVGAGDVAQADVDLMKAEGLSWLIQGRLVEATAGAGRSCPPGTVDTTDPACLVAAEIPFEFKLNSGTNWSDCEDGTGTGTLGFAVAAGATVDVKPTLHGDHWFFNNITIGSEETDRLAQHFANAAFDQVSDGVAPNVTLEVLAGIQAADLFPNPPYTLAGALIDVQTGADYVIAQTHPSGHLNGEGECVPAVLQ